MVRLTYADVAEAEQIAISDEVRSIGRFQRKCCGPDPFTWPLALANAAGHGKLPDTEIEFLTDTFDSAPVTNALRECNFAAGKRRLSSACGNSPGISTYSGDHVLSGAKTHHKLATRTPGASAKTKRHRRTSGYHVFLQQQRLTKSSVRWKDLGPQAKQQWEERADKLYRWRQRAAQRQRERLSQATINDSTPFGIGDEDYPLREAVLEPWMGQLQELSTAWSLRVPSTVCPSSEFFAQY